MVVVLPVVIFNPKMDIKLFSLIFNYRLIMSEKNVGPSVVKKWIAIIIAILSAIAGALGESATGFIGKIF